jgi:hypothetical protein
MAEHLTADLSVAALAQRVAMSPRNFQRVYQLTTHSKQRRAGILDSVRYDGTNPVVYIGDNLKDALIECERMNTPAPKLRYTKRGQVGFVSNDDEEVE